MSRNPELGNVLLDVALVGIMLTTIGVIVDLFGGGGVNVGLLGVLFASYVPYMIGALRLGTSPLRYLTTVYKRGSLPR